jgi:hypothetical protein
MTGIIRLPFLLHEGLGDRHSRVNFRADSEMGLYEASACVFDLFVSVSNFLKFEAA